MRSNIRLSFAGISRELWLGTWINRLSHLDVAHTFMKLTFLSDALGFVKFSIRNDDINLFLSL